MIEVDLWYFEEDMLWDCGYLCALYSSSSIWRCELMKHKVYSVYDSKSEVWMRPLFMRADGEAIRAFKASVADQSHQFGMNPGDYTLFAIGEYDDDNGRMLAYDVYVNLGNGVQMLSKEVNHG